MMPEERAIIAAVRKRLTSPECWIDRVFALAPNGYQVNPEDHRAVCWCLDAAIDRETMWCSFDLESTVRALVASAITNTPNLTDDQAHYHIQVWNDEPGRTHAEVLALLDRVLREEMR